MTATTAPTAATRPAPESFDSGVVRNLAGVGVIAGLVMVFISAIGMLETFDGRSVIDPILSLGYLVLFAVPAVAGHSFTRREVLEGVEVEPRTVADVGKAVLAGAVSGLVLAVFALIVATYPDIRGTFPKLSPKLVDLMTLGFGTGAAFVVLPLVSGAIGAVGAGVSWIPDRPRKAIFTGGAAIPILAAFEPLVDDLFDWLPALPDFLYAPSKGLTVTSAIVVFVLGVVLSLVLPGRVPSVKSRLQSSDSSVRRRTTVIIAAVIGLATIVLPQFLGGIANELTTNVGLFALMALGLNVVVGYAGLLDLGYVAFFAVGAYTMGILTSPLSPAFTPELSWWVAFPFVLVAAAFAGLMVGTPVLRMRGDYLAIVTLGFGEIVRILLLSDWLAPIFGGAQGIRNIPGIPLFGQEINATTPNLMVYFVLAFVFIAAYISWRAEDSRIGRAWAALREDEDVAEAVGVDTVKAKLMAFVTGAVMASFAGALFAAKVGSVFTNSFQILVSIIILVIVIVGGMGNIAGVIVGALVLIGVLGGPNQPGLLQEFGEFKLLIYGALLVYMMLQRPEGLLPSKRRQQELHQEEFLQDAWLEKGGKFAESADDL